MKVVSLWNRMPNWVKKPRWDVIGIVATFVGTILAIILAPIVTREFLSDTYWVMRANWSETCLVLVLLVLVIVLIKHRTRRRNHALEIREFAEKQTQLLAEKEGLTEKLAVAEKEGFVWNADKQESRKFERFERINKIVYGHIEYYPLVYYSQKDDFARGIGIRLIEEIFGKTVVSKYPNRGRWEELVNKLSAGEYDIVATPLYETRERSKIVSFCSPIFFSDIGVYIKPNSELFGAREKNQLTFEQAVQLLQRLKNVLQLTAIDGELSGKMILKHVNSEKAKVNWLDRDESNVAGLISSVADDSRPSDVVFAEVFQAEQTEAVKNGSVINLLEPKQLLYPVSFAIRKQEYVLRHFINLKLAEIDEEYAGGILGFILDELKKHPDFKDFDLPKVRQYFVREKPDKLMLTNPPITSGSNGKEKGS